MLSRHLTTLGAALVLVTIAGCGTGAPSATPTPVAATYQEFHDGFCSAWESMFKAVGNPDTGSVSDLGSAMDRAIDARDTAAVDRAAKSIQDELTTGRRHAAFAAGWGPGKPVMVVVDKVLEAFQAMTEAKRASAGQGRAQAQALAQKALETAGGIDAWFWLIRSGPRDAAMKAIEAARPAGAVQQCANVPIGI